MSDMSRHAKNYERAQSLATQMATATKPSDASAPVKQITTSRNEHLYTAFAGQNPEFNKH